MRIKTTTLSDFRCKSFSRCSGPGGGICLFYRGILSSVTNSSRITKFETFEFSRTDISLNSTLFTFLCTGIYRPPPSEKNKFTLKGFILDFESFSNEYANLKNETVIL